MDLPVYHCVYLLWRQVASLLTGQQLVWSWAQQQQLHHSVCWHWLLLLFLKSNKSRVTKHIHGVCHMSHDTLVFMVHIEHVMTHNTPPCGKPWKRREGWGGGGICKCGVWDMSQETLEKEQVTSHTTHFRNTPNVTQYCFVQGKPVYM